jgi:hypothetical protein
MYFITLQRYLNHVHAYSFTRGESYVYEFNIVSLYRYGVEGRAIAQAVSRWLPTAAARVRVRTGMWGLWWTKRHWGRFSPSTSVSPAIHRSTNFSIIIIARCCHNRPIGGLSAEWTQLDFPPPPTIPNKNTGRTACVRFPVVQSFFFSSR